MDRTLRELLAGNADHAESFDDRFGDVQTGQRPAVVSVSCSDSRVLGDSMWDNDRPGAIFTCVNIGNRVLQRTDGDTVVSGDVLYPLVHTGTDTAIVVGHTGCGAVTAAYRDLTDGLEEPPGIDHSLSLLRPLLEPGVAALPDELDERAAINRLVEYNVDRQVEVLRASEHVPDGTDVAGVVYDFQDVYGGRRGEVHVVNVDGVTDVERLRGEYPEIAERVDRLWRG
jgi:carbonic anhydrase